METFNPIPELSGAKAVAIASGFGAAAFLVALALGTTLLEAFVAGVAIALGLSVFFAMCRRSGPIDQHRARFTVGGAAFIGGLLVVPALALEHVEDAIFVCVLSFVICVGVFWFATSRRLSRGFTNQLVADTMGGELCSQCGRAQKAGRRCSWCGQQPG